MFGLTNEEELAVLGGPKRTALAFRILVHVSEVGDATAHECSEALHVPNQSLSVRFSELVKSGCLTHRGKKRRTKSGGLALICKVAEEADFKTYLALVRVKSKKSRGLSDVEQKVLTAGMEFLAKWKRAKTQKGRQDASVTLVNSLVRIQG